jgi:hypothetical protein
LSHERLQKYVTCVTYSPSKISRTVRPWHPNALAYYAMAVSYARNIFMKWTLGSVFTTLYFLRNLGMGPVRKIVIIH